MGLWYRVVLELMEGLEDHEFKLHTYDYYTSPWLFFTLTAVEQQEVTVKAFLSISQKEGD